MELFVIVIAILAGISNVLTFLWLILFGSKTLRQIIEDRKSGRPARAHAVTPGKSIFMIGVANLVFTLCLIGLVIFLILQPKSPEFISVPTNTSTLTATTPTHTTTPTPSPSVTFTSSPSSVWRPLHSPFSPTCNDPSGTSWKLITPQASCMNGALVMQQNSDTFAELDLSQMDGKAFNLTKFRVQVQVTFLAPIDGNTTAAFDVQLAQPANGITGYDFELYPDSTLFNGPAWAIEHIREGGKNDDKTGIDSSDHLTSVQSHVLTMATMAIVVQDNVFICYVNGLEVGSHPLSSSLSAFGLMVARQHVGGYSPSPIQFTQFELDVPA